MERNPLEYRQRNSAQRKEQTKMIALKDKIARACAEAAADETNEAKKERPPEPTLKLKGFWEKKRVGEEVGIASWVARVTGLGIDLEGERMTLVLSFEDLYSEIV
jgi:hypothetical protein